ncbi:hypothetical protein MMC11_004235 [Xylographa trunciseda]|nr:hypothetical protein [Xylographa trunciseda]
MPFIQPTVTPNPDNLNLAGQTIIITGANAGLGFECARQLLISHASTVVLAVRTISKGEAARARLLANPEINKRNANADIKIMKLDMEDYQSVIAFADNVKKELHDLHVLLLNAGIGQLGFEVSVTGHEKVTQVNYLSNALLSLELLPLLEATAARTGKATRMSWVGSRMHDENSLLSKQPILPGESVLAHFDDKSKYLTIAHYGDTKLLCVMFIAEMAARVPKEKVIINIMCPGMVNTGMSDVLPFYLRPAMNFVKMLRARTPEEGGWIINYAAVVAGPETHGRYLKDKELVESTKLLRTTEGQALQRQLWLETIDEMTRVDSRVSGVVTG